MHLTVKAGDARSMATAVDVSQSGYRIGDYAMDGETLVDVGRYERDFDATGARATGLLTPIDITAPVLSFDFEDSGPVYANCGGLGRQYDLICTDCDGGVGRNGTRALRVTGRAATLSDRYVSPIFFDGQQGTMSLWLRIPDADGKPRTVLSTQALTGTKGFELIARGAGMHMRVNTRAEVRFDAPGDMSDGTWHHIVLRHGAGRVSDMDVWVDGARARVRHTRIWGRLFDGAPRGIPWMPMTFGGNGRSASGSALDLDALRYWARALSDQEIASLIASGGEIAQVAPHAEPAQCGEKQAPDLVGMLSDAAGAGRAAPMPMQDSASPGRATDPYAVD